VNPTDAGDAIVAEITINASAERVFEALVDPQQRIQWWGAKGRFETTHMESDLRVGGAWEMRGKGMEGRPFTLRGEYLHIERPRLLEFTFADWEAQNSVVRFELEEKGGVTNVRLVHSGFGKQGAREKYQGWPWLLALLKAHAESASLAES
jgi:uncharacterized protein YndB with AHSA1/START domain